MRTDLEFSLTCEEVKWAQKAREMWTLQGDRNTSYFHAVVNHQRSLRKIGPLMDNNNNWLSNQEETDGNMHQFYQRLYTRMEENVCFVEVLQDIHIPSFNAEQTMALSLPFTHLEVEKDLFSIPPDKMAGPDRMTARLFQHSWHLLKIILEWSHPSCKETFI